MLDALLNAGVDRGLRLHRKASAAAAACHNAPWRAGPPTSSSPGTEHDANDAVMVVLFRGTPSLTLDL